MILRVIIVSAVAALVAACAASSVEDSAHGRPALAGPCGAALVQQFKGRKLTDDLRARIAEISGASRIRVIRPGHLYTMEFRPERLRINVNEKGRITAFGCG